MKLKILSLIMIIFLLCSCSDNSEGNFEEDDGSNVIYITADNFESTVLSADKTVIIDFYADWCGPCQRMAPHLEEIAAERDDVIIGKVNVDIETSLASSFGIVSIPTLIIFKNGTEQQKAVGYRSKSAILSLIDE